MKLFREPENKSVRPPGKNSAPRRSINNISGLASELSVLCKHDCYVGTLGLVHKNVDPHFGRRSLGLCVNHQVPALNRSVGGAKLQSPQSIQVKERSKDVIREIREVLGYLYPKRFTHRCL